MFKIKLSTSGECGEGVARQLCSSQCSEIHVVQGAGMESGQLVVGFTGVNHDFLSHKI